MKKMKVTKKSFNRMRNTSDTLGLMHTAGNALLPVVKMKFQGKTIKFLVDTGSDNNLLDERIFELLKDKLEYEKMEGYTIGAAGKKIPKTFKTKMELTIGGRKYEPEFCVMRLGCFPDGVDLARLPFFGMLGSTFLIQNNWILDFEQCSFRVGHKAAKRL